jgi:cytochrome c551/c552
MKRTLLWGAALSLLLAAAGCGGGKSTTESKTAAPSGSPYDVGPRAGESPVAEALAEKGAALFKSKGCTACHAYGKRLTGPDLKGVTQRRTTKWMEQQILHPEIMTKEDPISRELMAQYALQMSNQGLTPDEATSVIEYLKKLDEESAEVAQNAEK